MSLVSTFFILFLALFIPLYYLLPKSAQWIVLLIFSLVFYSFGGLLNIIFLMFTSFSAFFCTYKMDKLLNTQKLFLKENKDILSKDQKKEYKYKIKNKRKSIMLVVIILNLLLLAFLKANAIFTLLFENKMIDALNILMPLGVSYYTLQTIGYIIDVYWNRVSFEKNYFKVLLFVSFFPQITQGPISDYKQLSNELFTVHEFKYKSFSWGMQRVIWGFFKKLIIANLMLPYVKMLFNNYALYSGVTLTLGAFIVMIQLYADFSGYMDIVCGVSEILGIKLAENFNRPFFSKSLSEFWRRWHITLGVWFKKYVFFTVGTSNIANKLSRKVSTLYGNSAGQKAVTTLSLLTIWFSIGIWHSLTAPFILWGLANGFIMTFSVWMEPVYQKAKAALHICDKSKLWSCFQMARTFILVSLLEVFSDVGNIRNGLGYFSQLIKKLFVMPKTFSQLAPYVDNYTSFILIMVGMLCLIIISLFGRKHDFREYFNSTPLILRVLILAVIVFVSYAFGMPEMMRNGGEFMYAQF